MFELKNAASLSLGTACCLYLAVLLWVVLAARGRSGGAAPVPLSWQQHVAALAAAPIVMLVAASLLAFPTPKGPWVAGSIVAGGLIMLLLSSTAGWLSNATPQQATLGRLSLAFLLLAAANNFLPLEHDQLVNVDLGLLLGMGAVAGAAFFLADGGAGRLDAERTGLGIVLGGTATLVAAVAWGDNARGEFHIGAAFPHLLAGLTLLSSQITATLWPDPREQREQLLRTGVGALLAGSVSFLVLQFLMRAPLTWLVPVATGLLLPLLWVAMTPAPQQGTAGLDLPWIGLVYVLSGGGAILMANRFAGAYGVAICGLGLLLAAPLRRHGWAWLEALVAAMAARSLIQLYLERTYLSHYGVDLTHSYAFAALALGLSFPLVVAVARGLWLGRLWLAAWALALVLHLPLLLGFFLHIEPVAAFQEGVLATALLLGFLSGLPPGLLPDWLTGTADALPALLVGTTTVSLLSAPWAIQVANSERLLRLELFALLGAAVLLLAWLGSREQGHRPGPV